MSSFNKGKNIKDDKPSESRENKGKSSKQPSNMQSIPYPDALVTTLSEDGDVASVLSPTFFGSGIRPNNKPVPQSNTADGNPPLSSSSLARNIKLAPPMPSSPCQLPPVVTFLEPQSDDTVDIFDKPSQSPNATRDEEHKENKLTTSRMDTPFSAANVTSPRGNKPPSMHHYPTDPTFGLISPSRPRQVSPLAALSPGGARASGPFPAAYREEILSPSHSHKALRDQQRHNRKKLEFPNYSSINDEQKAFEEVSPHKGTKYTFYKPDTKPLRLNTAPDKVDDISSSTIPENMVLNDNDIYCPVGKGGVATTELPRKEVITSGGEANSQPVNPSHENNKWYQRMNKWLPFRGSNSQPTESDLIDRTRSGSSDPLIPRRHSRDNIGIEQGILGSSHQDRVYHYNRANTTKEWCQSWCKGKPPLSFIIMMVLLLLAAWVLISVKVTRNNIHPLATSDHPLMPKKAIPPGIQADDESKHQSASIDDIPPLTSDAPSSQAVDKTTKSDTISSIQNTKSSPAESPQIIPPVAPIISSSASDGFKSGSYIPGIFIPRWIPNSSLLSTSTNRHNDNLTGPDVFSSIESDFPHQQAIDPYYTRQLYDILKSFLKNPISPQVVVQGNSIGPLPDKHIDPQREKRQKDLDNSRESPPDAFMSFNRHTYQRWCPALGSQTCSTDLSHYDARKDHSMMLGHNLIDSNDDTEPEASHSVYKLPVVDKIKIRDNPKHATHDHDMKLKTASELYTLDVPLPRGFSLPLNISSSSNKLIKKSRKNKDGVLPDDLLLHSDDTDAKITDIDKFVHHTSVNPFSRSVIDETSRMKLERVSSRWQHSSDTDIYFSPPYTRFDNTTLNHSHPLPEHVSIGISDSIYQRDVSPTQFDKLLDMYQSNEVLGNSTSPAAVASGYSVELDTLESSVASLFSDEIRILKFLGVSTYRLALRWNKIMSPSGSMLRQGLSYYDTIVSQLIHNDITPILTLHDYYISPPDELASISSFRTVDSLIRPPLRLNQSNRTISPSNHDEENTESREDVIASMPVGQGHVSPREVSPDFYRIHRKDFKEADDFYRGVSQRDKEHWLKRLFGGSHVWKNSNETKHDNIDDVTNEKEIKHDSDEKDKSASSKSSDVKCLRNNTHVDSLLVQTRLVDNKLGNIYPGLGWADQDMIRRFEKYSQVVFDHFSKKVNHWITFVEPSTICRVSYNDDPKRVYQCGHNILLAHLAAAELYNKKYRPSDHPKKNTLSMALHAEWYFPRFQSVGDINYNKQHTGNALFHDIPVLSSDHHVLHHMNITTKDKNDKKNEISEKHLPESLQREVQAQQRALDFTFGWFADVLYKGDYPSSMKDFLGDRLPSFSSHESRRFRHNTPDYMSITYFSSLYVAPTQKGELKHQCEPVYQNDDNKDKKKDHKDDKKDDKKPKMLSNSASDDICVDFHATDYNDKAIGPYLGGQSFSVPRGLSMMLLYIDRVYSNPSKKLQHVHEDEHSLHHHLRKHPPKPDSTDIFDKHIPIVINTGIVAPQSIPTSTISSEKERSEINRRYHLEWHMFDAYRVNYMQLIMSEIAITSHQYHVNVVGVNSVSVSDDYGLVYISPENGQRNPKMSFYWFKQLISISGNNNKMFRLIKGKKKL